MSLSYQLNNMKAVVYKARVLLLQVTAISSPIFTFDAVIEILMTLHVCLK
jgi:hypothetical protein